MPTWAYNMSPLALALLMVAVIEAVSLIALCLTRRYLLPRLRFHDGINDAISGTVQAIGVFYGITVGLIAVGVWSTYSNAGDLVSKEAAAIGGCIEISVAIPRLCAKLCGGNFASTPPRSSTRHGRHRKKANWLTPGRIFSTTCNLISIRLNQRHWVKLCCTAKHCGPTTR